MIPVLIVYGAAIFRLQLWNKDNKDTIIMLWVYTCLCIMWHPWHYLWCVCVCSMLSLLNLCLALITNRIPLDNINHYYYYRHMLITAFR